MSATAVTEPTFANAHDVRAWFDALHDAGISFHPEECFSDIADRETGEPTFTPAEATRLNAAMMLSRKIATERGGDICDIAMGSLLAHQDAGEPGQR
jgi:hypothetical protein